VAIGILLALAHFLLVDSEGKALGSPILIYQRRGEASEL